MIEIILVYFLCRWCYRTAKAKGYSGGWFAFLGAALWIGMEIIGCVAGVFIMIQSNTDYFTAYGFALAGAAVGAIIAYGIVRLLKPKPGAPCPARAGVATSSYFPVTVHETVYCRRCGSPIAAGRADCEKCGEPAGKNNG